MVNFLNQQQAGDIPQNSAEVWDNILNMEGSDITHMALQILAAAPQRILLLDKQSKVLAVTEDCLQQVLHRERAAVLMQFLPVALGFAEQGGCVEHLAEVLAVQEALEGFVPWSGQLHLPNNSLPWQVKVAPLLGKDGSWLAAVLVFLERQRDAAALEEDLRRRNQAARYQDAIHMVKNRLQNIGGMLQVLDKKCEINNIHLETLDLLRQEHAEAVKLLADFVQEGNLQANVGNCDLNQLVLDVVSMQKSHFVVKRIDLETALAEGLPKIWLDRQRIKQVIISCLDNSFEAILAKGQPGGRVLLTTQLDEARGMVRLLVEDNGVGLSAEQQANFFKPYYTTKPQGNGIGTSISESIVRLHGGGMSVCGRPGEGCCVVIELPLRGGQLFNREDLYSEIAEMF